MPTIPSDLRAPQSLHAVFLTEILPRVETHGRFAFRDLKSQAKDDAVQEMVALCWKWFLRLVERGKDATQFPTALADFAARAVRASRRLTGQDRAGDVLSKVAQRQHGFTVEPLPNSPRRPFEEVYTAVDGQRRMDAYEEMLVDNTATPVPEQAAFRIDFPTWRRTRTYRDRRIMDDLMVGERTSAVARKHGLTPGRISQLRREFHDDWLFFCGGSRDADEAPA
jgi:hypothetical protein